MPVKVTVLDNGKIEGYCTASEYAKKHGVSFTPIYRYINDGRLKSLRVGSLTFVKEDQPYPKSKCYEVEIKHRLDMQNPMDILAARMHDRMDDLKMTQAKLAELTGIHESYFSRFNAKKQVRDIRAKTLKTIASAVNVSADWLCGLNDIPQPIGYSSDNKNNKLNIAIFKERLAKAFQQLDISREAFCDKHDLDLRSFEKYLSQNDGILPNTQNLIKLVKALDISIDWLLGMSLCTKYVEGVA